MDFVIVSTADWDNPFWTNKQHVAATLADMGHRVLYIDSLGLRQPTMTKSDFGRIKSRMMKLFSGTKKVRENIWVMAPFSIPLQRYSVIRWLNEFILIYMIRKIMKKIEFKSPILWIYNPMTYYLIGQLNEKKSVYHCVDDISAQPGMPKVLIQESEIKLLQAVDVVFTTSITLNKDKEKYNSNCYYYSNVADFNHFHKAYTDVFERPTDLPNDGKSILGFIGAISGYKQDFKLLGYVAEKCPEYNIVLIGKVGEGDPYTNIGELKKYKNIFFLGPKAYSELPCYLSFFDLALLPCCINEYTNYMFPMKFFEYISAGKVVITTEILALAEFRDYCKMANSYSGFVQAIKSTLDVNDKVDMITKNFSLAKKYTYFYRMQLMLKYLV